MMWKVGNHIVVHGDARDTLLVNRLVPNGIETLVFDPPYDKPDLMAMRWPVNKDVISFCDLGRVDVAIRDWTVPFRHLFIWDTQACWYVKNRPLARGKGCIWLGNTAYRQGATFHMEGPPDLPASGKNERGAFNYVPDPRGKWLASVFQCVAKKKFPGHRHAKPLKWVEMLLGNCTTGTIFDPFAGSGSTLAAAEALNRPSILIEIEAGQVEAILLMAERITGHTRHLVNCPEVSIAA